MIQKIKEFYKKNFKGPKDVFFFFSPIIIALILIIPVPYTVTVSGGTISFDDKIKVDDEIKKEGSLNGAYVKELNGNVLTYLLAKINKNYELTKIEDVTLEGEDKDDYYFREKMYFNNSSNNAIKVAYNYLNKEVTVIKNNIYVIYIDKEANTLLEVGDIILKINDISVSSIDDVNNTLKDITTDTFSILVLRDNKEKTVTSSFLENEKKIGIYLQEEQIITTTPKVNLNFSSKETGPSGGLMMTLSIYNKLVKEDITKGKKIVGTGTIDSLGNVGEISGIKYKLKGAVNKKADIFLCPLENLEEALKEKEKHNYKIEIYGVKTFKEALKVLENIA